MSFLSVFLIVLLVAALAKLYAKRKITSVHMCFIGLGLGVVDFLYLNLLQDVAVFDALYRSFGVVLTCFMGVVFFCLAGKKHKDIKLFFQF